MSCSRSKSNKNLTVEEMKTAFSYFDRNLDGSIEAEELGYVMKALGYKVYVKELQQMIKLADLDGNNKIDFDEFVNIMSQENFENDSFEEGEILLTVFQVFDRNNKGFIDRKDLQRAMRDLGEDLTENEIDLMMKEADKDNDGKIDYEEFKMIMNTQKGKSYLINK